MENCHFLVVTFPAQGHINPTLQFSKLLAKSGVKVTFATSFAAIVRMNKIEVSLPKNLTIVPFSDGYDDGWASVQDFRHYYTTLVTIGSKNLEKLIMEQAKEGHPVTHVVYSTLMSWVGELIQKLKIPSTLLWIQPAALFVIYYHYFHEYGEIIGECDETNSIIELPGLPPLTSRDLPSFLLKSNPDIYNFALPSMKKHFEVLEKNHGDRPTILVNSFDGLEVEALRAVEKIKFVAVGPLVPSAYLDGKDPFDASFGGDLLHSSNGDSVIEWLNSKDKNSVVYVAFGSYSELGMKQMEEIGKGLLQSKKPFLWVIRKAKNGEKSEDKLGCRDELEKQGMIVEWCSQVEVLSHSSVGCFLSHCGWNSSIESLVCGVPVFGIPQWTDQTTNVKLIQDVWKTGIRAVANEEGIIEADEIRRGLEIVMESEEMRNNAAKWRGLAIDAAKDGGSSNVNLKAFVDEVQAASSAEKM
ncbi:OLC1v1018935C1 [Oldenlandia corymbosa var. corymbosa]|uniref:Glycosyltransferase n=1 Tax=Oldenlandia corymbosa var. corymbosa TaxID=529605 RepID=A0AAV1ECZ8_OLDCO|nr:OLC1v1018935C1 [Oldenlandia corymbosa var. corymbosa]